MKNKICPLCGRKFSSHSNINKDHLIPQAVATWSKELLTKQEYSPLRHYINSAYNIYLVHEFCNYRKQSILLNLSQVRKLSYSKEDLLKISEMYISLNSQLNCFRSKINQTKNLQNNRCYSCRRKLGNHFVIRRINSKKTRSWKNNVCLVCNRCNTRYKEFTYTKKKK